MKVAAILPAAGLGTRMGKASETGTRKQWIELAGTPVVIHTLRRFDEASSIDEMVVALREEDRAPLEQHLAEESFSKSIRLVDGGRTRQESVQNGLAAVSPDVSIVSVHDAVRPLISVELIDRSVEQALADGAVILGLPAVDTVKRVDQKVVHATLPREMIMLAQTPQVFQADLLRRAYAKAAEDGFTGTDEASLVEHLGEDVHVMLGSPHNIKITRPEDLALAEFYLSSEAPDDGAATSQ